MEASNLNQKVRDLIELTLDAVYKVTNVDDIETIFKQKDSANLMKAVLRAHKKYGTNRTASLLESLINTINDGKWEAGMPEQLVLAARRMVPKSDKAVWKKAQELAGFSISDLPKETFGLYSVRGEKVDLGSLRPGDQPKPYTKTFLNQRGIEMYRPFEHPPTVFDNNFVMTHFEVLERVPHSYILTVIDEQTKIEMPWLRSHAPNRVISSKLAKTKYYPSYWSTGIDQVVYTVMNNMRAQGRGNECQQILDVANTHFYGNGSLEGQYGRFRKVIEAKESVPPRTAERFGFNLQYVNPVGFKLSSILSPVYVIKTPNVPNLFEHQDFSSWLHEYQMQFETPNGGTYPIVEYNMQSSSGIWCGKATTKNGDPQLGIETIMNCTTQLHRFIHEGGDFDSSPAALQSLKPKPEVYERSELLEKTRNICSMNAISTGLLQALYTPFFKSRPHFKQSDFKMYSGPIPAGNMNLMGWSPAQGFMQNLIEVLEEAPEKSMGIYFYADNLYMFSKQAGDVLEISADGSKMECSHDLNDAQWYFDFILSHYGDVSPETRNVAHTIHMNQMCNAPVLLGSYVIRQRWLSSGFVHTAEFNCLKMSQIVSCLVEIHNRQFKGHTSHLPQGQLDILNKMADWDALMARHGNLCELQIHGLLAPLYAYFGVTMKNEKVNHNILKTLQTKHRVDLDFLGYGVSEFVELRQLYGKPVYLTTLDEARLNKMLAFRKSEYGNSMMKQLTAAVRENITMLAKAQSALLQGAWYQVELRKLVRASFYRAAIDLADKTTIGESSAHLKQLLKEEGFQINFTVSSVNPFNLQQLLDIMAHPDVLSVVGAQKDKLRELEQALEMNFAIEEHETSEFKITSSLVAPILREINKEGSQGKTFPSNEDTEQSVSTKLRNAAKRFQTGYEEGKEITFIKCSQLQYMNLITKEQERVLGSLAKSMVGKIGHYLEAIQKAYYDGSTAIKLPPPPSTGMQAYSNFKKLLEKLADASREAAYADKQLKEFIPEVQADESKMKHLENVQNTKDQRLADLRSQVMKGLPQFIRAMYTKKDYNFSVFKSAVLTMNFSLMKGARVDDMVPVIYGALKSVRLTRMVTTEKTQGTFIMKRAYVMYTPKSRRYQKTPRKQDLPSYGGMMRNLYYNYIMQSAGVTHEQVQKLNLGPYINELFDKGPRSVSPTYRIHLTVTDFDTFQQWLDPASPKDPINTLISSLESLSNSTYGAAQRVSAMRGLLRSYGLSKAALKVNNDVGSQIIKQMMRAKQNFDERQTDATPIDKVRQYGSIIYNEPKVATENADLPFVRMICEAPLYRKKPTTLQGLVSRYKMEQQHFIRTASLICQTLGISIKHVNCIMVMLTLIPSPRVKPASKFTVNLNFLSFKQNPPTTPYAHDWVDFINGYSHGEAQRISEECAYISKVQDETEKINRLASMFNSLFGATTSNWSKGAGTKQHAITKRFLDLFSLKNPMFALGYGDFENVPAPNKQEMEMFEFLQKDNSCKFMAALLSIPADQSFFFAAPFMQELLLQKGYSTTNLQMLKGALEVGFRPLSFKDFLNAASIFLNQVESRDEAETILSVLKTQFKDIDDLGN